MPASNFIFYFFFAYSYLYLSKIARDYLINYYIRPWKFVSFFHFRLSLKIYLISLFY